MARGGQEIVIWVGVTETRLTVVIESGSVSAVIVIELLTVERPTLFCA